MRRIGARDSPSPAANAVWLSPLHPTPRSAGRGRGWGVGGLSVLNISMVPAAPPPTPDPSPPLRGHGCPGKGLKVIQMTQVRISSRRVPGTSKGACAASTCYDSGKLPGTAPLAAGGGERAHGRCGEKQHRNRTILTCIILPDGEGVLRGQAEQSTKGNQ